MFGPYLKPIVYVLALAWVICFAFLVGEGTEQQNERIQIDAANRAGNVASNPKTETGTEQAPEIKVLGVRLGEAILAFVSVLLWLATRDLVKSGKDTAQRQLRAYVYLEVTGRAYPPPPKIPDRCSITLTIKNSGSTWARNVRVKHVMAADAKEDDVFSAVKWDEIKPHPILIGPGQETGMQFGDLSGEDLRDIIANKRRVFFLARVAYEDILSNPPIARQTQLFRQFIADEEGGISFAWMPTHNCADDDCPKEG